MRRARRIDTAKYRDQGLIEFVGEEIADWDYEEVAMSDDGWLVEQEAVLTGWSPYTVLFSAECLEDEHEPVQMYAVENTGKWGCIGGDEGCVPMAIDA